MGFPFIGDIISGAASIIDDLHTSGEEKLEAKTKLLTLQTDFTRAAMDYEATLVRETSQTIRAEATGHSWLQRNWRPGVMTMFAYIVFHNYVLAPVFGVGAVDMPDQLWALLQLGIGGYVVGRSAEKIATVVTTLKAKDLV
jgi:hypothetical protein